MKINSLHLHDYMVNKKEHLMVSVNSKYRIINKSIGKDIVVRFQSSQWTIVDTIFSRRIWTQGIL